MSKKDQTPKANMLASANYAKVMYKDWNSSPPVKWRVRRTGPYTVVEVQGKRLMGIGVAKRNPIDRENRNLGFQLALARALRDYADTVEKEIVK